MADVNVIRHLHLRQGWSERRIARELGLGRRTVHKYLTRDASTEVPAYTRKQPVQSPKMGRYEAIIDAWLLSDAKAPPKQRHTAVRIRERLKEEYGVDLPASTVRHFVARRREALGLDVHHREAFLHLAYAPGEMAQVDWGMASVVIDGHPQTAWMFCMRLGFSQASFVRLYPHGRMEAFLDGHVHAFTFFGGVVKTVLYDNLRSAVSRILHGRGRQLNPRFAALAAHYVFTPTFATPASGWEKGLVENLVGYARRNFLVPVPHASSFEALNQDLHARLLAERDRVQPEHMGQTLGDLWDEERRHLLPLPPSPFRASTTYRVRVSRQLTVRHLGVQYSVPFRYMSRTLRLEALHDHVEIYDHDRLVARHALGRPGAPPVLDLEHYLDVLMRKPGGVRHARVVRDLGQTVEAYRDAFLAARPDAYRSFVDILLLCRRHPREVVLAAIAQAHAERIYDVAGVERLITSGQRPSDTAELPAGPAVHQPPVARYDTLVANQEVAR